MGTITLTLYPRLGLAHLQGHGDISEAMILRDLEKLPHHPEWQPSYNTLVDLGGAVLRCGPESIRDQQSPDWPGGIPSRQAKPPLCKWAICAGNDQARQQLGQRLAAYHGVIVDIFRHRGEALQFLDLSPQQWLTRTTSTSESSHDSP